MPKKSTQPWSTVVLVCDGSDCKKAGAKGLRKAAHKSVKDHGADAIVLRFDCADLCDDAPVACVQPANEWLAPCSPDALEAAIGRAVDAARTKRTKTRK